MSLPLCLVHGHVAALQAHGLLQSVRSAFDRTRCIWTLPSQVAKGAAAVVSFAAGAGTAIVEKLGGLDVNDR